MSRHLGRGPLFGDTSPTVAAIGDVSTESPLRIRSHLRVGFRLLTVIERIGAALAPVGEAISESDGKATRIAGVSRRRQDVVVVCFFVMVYLAF